MTNNHNPPPAGIEEARKIWTSLLFQTPRSSWISNGLWPCLITSAVGPTKWGGRVLVCLFIALGQFLPAAVRGGTATLHLLDRSNPFFATRLRRWSWLVIVVAAQAVDKQAIADLIEDAGSVASKFTKGNASIDSNNNESWRKENS